MAAAAQGSGARNKNGELLLTVLVRYGKAPTLRGRPACPRPWVFLSGRMRRHMVKPEWGSKRTCPKCATRFYDLGKDDPVNCIECGNVWTPEPVLKSKQPLPFEEAAPKAVAGAEAEAGPDDDLDIDIDVDEAEGSPDNDVDLGGDDDLGVEAADDNDEEN
jgi:uncharacterized protein (TIGR02300 family)